MKTSLKGRYDNDVSSAAATVVFNAGDVKLRASLAEITVLNGSSLEALSLAVEKPGLFIVDYNVPKRDFRFHFMNKAKIADKSINLTYIHHKNENRTVLDGTLVFNGENKVSANHVLGTRNYKLKYTYLHDSATAFEPSYDFAKDAWDFSISRKVYDDDVFKATYHTSSQILGLEWLRNSKLSGNFKVSASVNLGEKLKTPKFLAESTWNFDL